MVKFRQSNVRRGRGGNAWFARIILFTVVIFAALAFITFKASDFFMGGNQNYTSEFAHDDRFFLPDGADGQTVHHKYYSLNYNEKYEQPSWVAYVLTKADLKKPNVKRAKKFKADYDVKTRSAFHRDYTHSGFTRGHMAPAGDMAFNETAMQESFYMSNMCPQIRAFNNGIWRELEETVRDWAYDNDRLYLVSGPVLKDVDKRIGDNRVGVPKAFFKVILDADGSNKRSIAYLIPHEKSDRSLEEYAMSVDDLEALVGLDFFPDMIDEVLEPNIESSYDQSDWPLNKSKFKERVKHWNNQ